jgi:hypothetical protein
MNFDLPELTQDAPQGALRQVKVSELKPTQNAVGFDEVHDKTARYSAKSKRDLKDYLLVHSVPIVIDDWILKDKIREVDVLIGNLPEEYRKEIIDEAMNLARSPEAAGMPGYLGPS